MTTEPKAMTKRDQSLHDALIARMLEAVEAAGTDHRAILYPLYRPQRRIVEEFLRSFMSGRLAGWE